MRGRNAWLPQPGNEDKDNAGQGQQPFGVYQGMKNPEILNGIWLVEPFEQVPILGNIASPGHQLQQGHNQQEGSGPAASPFAAQVHAHGSNARVNPGHECKIKIQVVAENGFNRPIDPGQNGLHFIGRVRYFQPDDGEQRTLVLEIALHPFHTKCTAGGQAQAKKKPFFPVDGRNLHEMGVVGFDE